ncbi:MAG TPA: hypothetical protein VGD87_03055, partial [Archangium sp.]
MHLGEGLRHAGGDAHVRARLVFGLDARPQLLGELLEGVLLGLRQLGPRDPGLEAPPRGNDERATGQQLGRRRQRLRLVRVRPSADRGGAHGGELRVLALQLLGARLEGLRARLV